MPRVRVGPRVRPLIAGSAVNSLGTGLVLPLVLIYLHRVRHIPLATTGLLLALPGIVSLVAVPLSGTVMDRVGPRRVLVWALSAQAVAQLGLAVVHTPAQAVPVLLLQGIALGPTFPAYNTLLARLEPDPSAQQRAFAINFTAINAAIGVGGLISAAVVQVRQPATFQWLFVGNAITCVATASVLLRFVPAPGVIRVEAGTPSVGYREVLADQLLRRMLLLTFLLAMTGYAALDSGLPAYANVVARVPARIVALGLSANTITIVAVQLVVLRLLRGRRRSRALIGVGLIWTAAWALFGTAALPGSAAGRDIVVIAFAALFGFGETFMAPTAAPLLNTLAPDRIRGRANALTSGMYSVAFVVSPAISAGFISAGLGAVWIGLLCLGGLAVAVVAGRLGIVLRPDQDFGRSTSAAAPEVGLEPTPS